MSATVRSEPHLDPRILGTDQPEGRVLGQQHSIIHILVPSHAGVHRLPQQIHKRKLCIVGSRIGPVLLNKFAESKAIVPLPYQKQSPVGKHP